MTFRCVTQELVGELVGGSLMFGVIYLNRPTRPEEISNYSKPEKPKSTFPTVEEEANCTYNKHKVKKLKDPS